MQTDKIWIKTGTAPRAQLIFATESLLTGPNFSSPIHQFRGKRTWEICHVDLKKVVLPGFTWFYPTPLEQ